MTYELRLTTRAKTVILSSVVCCLSLVAPLALAQQLSSQLLSLSVVNPDGPISQVRVVFDLPPGFMPTNLGVSTGWNKSNSQVSVNLGSMAPGETRQVSVALSAPAGVYTITGKTYGFWDQVAQPFSSDIAPIVLVFQNPGSSLGGAALPTNTPGSSQQGNPDVVQIAKTISLPVAVGLGGIGIISLITSSYAASASFAAELSRIASYIGFGLFRLKKRKPWGKVVNHLTGRPIEGASVKILDSAFKKVKETQFTDHDGRFGFLVPPGDYFIRVSKNGFGEYESKVFRVSGDDQILNLEVNVEPLKTTLADYALRAVRFWHRINWFLAKINPVVLVLGLLAGIISAFLTPNLTNYLILGGYVVLIVVNLILSRIFMRSFGRVLVKGTDEPVPLAIVRLFDVKENWLLGTRVTDEAGRFNYLIGSGNYYVTAAKDHFAGYQSQPTHFSRSSVLNYDIKLDKQ